METVKFESKIVGGYHTTVLTTKESIILYYSGDYGSGAIVSGNSFEEAQKKYVEAMQASRSLKIILASMNDDEREATDVRLTDEYIHNKYERIKE